MPQGAGRRWTRREALALLGGTGATLAVSCSDDASPVQIGTTPTAPTPTAPGGTAATCTSTPSETAGPFPSLADFIRSDIREGKPGLPLTLTLTIVNTNHGCTPIAGALVEIWQCDADGNYSQYGSDRNQTYLRGLQVADAAGRVTFTTIYPGWYQGRATHIHVEVTANGRPLKVTQLAFPEDITAAVYRTGAYASSGPNPMSNARDTVFADGVSTQLVTLVGDTTNGHSGTFQIGVAL